MNRERFQFPFFSMRVGWARILIILLVSWIVVVGCRLFYELDGQATEAFLVDKKDNPADFTESDFDIFESHLRANLKNSSLGKSELDESENPYMKLANEYRQQKEERLIELLETFGEPILSEESIAGVAAELSISKQNVRNSVGDAKRYAQLRNLRQMMAESSVLKNQVMGVKRTTYSVNWVSTLFTLLSLPMAIYFLGALLHWVRQGFLEQE